MMGHKERLKGGDEWDAFSKWRKYFCYLSKAGVVKKIKRSFWKRIRQLNKKENDNESMGN